MKIDQLRIMLSHRGLELGPMEASPVLAADVYSVRGISTPAMNAIASVIYCKPGVTMGKTTAVKVLNAIVSNTLIICENVSSHGMAVLASNHLVVTVMAPGELVPKMSSSLVPNYTVMNAAERRRADSEKCNMPIMLASDPIARYLGLSVGDIVTAPGNVVRLVV